MSAEEASYSTLRTWRDTVPPVSVPESRYNKDDPIPGVFQRMAAMVASAVPLPTSLPPSGPPSTDEENFVEGSGKNISESDDSEAAPDGSSSWESQESLEAGMDDDMVMEVEVLPPGVDTGGSYFATS